MRYNYQVKCEYFQPPPPPGAIKAERVCRLVLLGVRACSPFEEGILHAWIGLVAHPLRWG